MFDAYKLVELRELSGLTQGEFARAIGLTRELVNKMESGKAKISKRTAERVKSFLEQHQAPDFSQDVNFTRPASQSSQNSHSRGSAAAVPYYLVRREQKNEDTFYLVPLVGIKAQAGYIQGFEQVDYVENLEKYSLPPGVNPAGAVWRYFEIDGDSMEPTLCAGDVVLATMVPAEDWVDIRNFYVYVLLTEDRLLIKRIYKKSDSEWVLISDNEEMYPQMTIQAADVRQLWVFRRQIRSRAPRPKEFKITV
jgi:phage repressor protein C with HTH and peptisase S24 domain